MATQTPSIALILLALTPFLLYDVQAQKAPAPAPQPLNLTGILDKAGQYSTLIRLLGSTQVGNQIVNQVNNSDQGLTLLAPTDNAFNNLKPGTLNGLSTQDQVALILYHVLPKYYTMQMFDTISNPVRTQATGNDGGNYYLNFTSSANQVNVSTGIVETQINNALYTEFPLAVYQLDAVLLPLDLFGPKQNKTASPPPSSSPAKKSPSSSSSSSSSSGPSASDNSTPNSASRVMNVRWSFICVIGFLIMGAIW